MKVQKLHLLTRVGEWSFCGKWFDDILYVNMDQADECTCLNCKRAHAAWQRRKEG